MHAVGSTDERIGAKQCVITHQFSDDWPQAIWIKLRTFCPAPSSEKLDILFRKENLSVTNDLYALLQLLIVMMNFSTNTHRCSKMKPLINRFLPVENLSMINAYKGHSKMRRE